VEHVELTYLSNAFFERFRESSNTTALGSNTSGWKVPPAHWSVDSCSEWLRSAMVCRNSVFAVDADRAHGPELVVLYEYYRPGAGR
jgi:hypothetical protein